MSKPDPAGGSLENILASIRKSLSEQSADALDERSAAPVEQDKDVRPARKQGLTQRLAGTTAEATPPYLGQSGDDLSDLLDDTPANPPPRDEAAPASDATSPAAATAAASGEKDPLWFLTRRDESAPEAASPPASAPAEPPPGAAATPPAEPKLTRPEVLRASMPPFFGSSTEAAKPPSASVEPAGQPAAGPQVTRPQGAAPATQASADAGMAREVSLLAAAAEAAAARPPPAAPPPVLNGKGPAMPSPEPALAADSPHTRALEVMVLDLLKPMLRQWLDENMPRMVAEALSEEVQRARAAKGDAKKT